MDNYIKEIFKLKNSEFTKLELSNKEILEQGRHFVVNTFLKPLSVWRMFYYIDRQGDFVNQGKLKHHRIARAWYNSLSSKRKLQILEYIGESCD